MLGMSPCLFFRATFTGIGVKHTQPKNPIHAQDNGFPTRCLKIKNISTVGNQKPKH